MEIIQLLRRQDAPPPPPRRDYDDCTSVSADCPVEATIYGYTPNLAANTIFVVIFGLCLLAHSFLGLKHRTWTYLIALWFGCLGETLGYIGRIMLWDNAWSENGFNIQICCLIISPAFITAGVYLTLKHIVLEISPKYSHLPPRYYTWIFITCDFISLVLQGAGGGTAATADRGSNMVDVGNDLMMAGIVWQVITLIVFGGLCADYARRVYSNRSSLPRSTYALLQAPRFKAFVAAISLAYVTIFTRCVYRIAEMAGGWRNHIMQDEIGFMILEAAMIAIATIALTVAHPGVLFPEMAKHKVKGWDGKTDVEQNVEKGRHADGSDSSSPVRAGVAY